MGDLLTQILAVGGILGSVATALLWRRQGRNIDADSRLKAAQAEVALSADARAWVEQYASEAREALQEAASCRDELRALRAHIRDWEAWARRNVRPDAEPMPQLTRPLPDPKIRPAD
jgi:hypothetical protein